MNRNKETEKCLEVCSRLLSTKRLTLPKMINMTLLSDSHPSMDLKKHFLLAITMHPDQETRDKAKIISELSLEELFLLLQGVDHVQLCTFYLNPCQSFVFIGMGHTSGISRKKSIMRVSREWREKLESC